MADIESLMPSVRVWASLTTAQKEFFMHRTRVLQGLEYHLKSERGILQRAELAAVILDILIESGYVGREAKLYYNARPRSLARDVQQITERPVNTGDPFNPMHGDEAPDLSPSTDDE